MARSGKIGRSIAIGSLAAVCLFPAILQAQKEDDFDPFTGYRMQRFRAPVDRPVPGVETIGAGRTAALASQGAILLDVHPVEMFELRADGSWITPRPHESLPGAVWLPVIGWGDLERWQSDYLTDALADLSGGDRRAAIVVFCQVDCWLSWNAARRIAEAGYENVFWFMDGVDGWRAGGAALAPVRPRPVANR